MVINVALPHVKHASGWHDHQVNYEFQDLVE